MINPTRIISIDPSSSICGYAAFTAGKLTDAGLIKPTRAKDPANVRIDAMIVSLLELVDEFQPDVIIIEDTSGKVGRRHEGRGAGLAVYGKAVGAVRQAMIGTGRRVVCILENEWTGGKGKMTRLHRIAALHRRYRLADDPGGDMGDAIGLGEYWIARHGDDRPCVAAMLAG